MRRDSYIITTYLLPNFLVCKKRKFSQLFLSESNVTGIGNTKLFFSLLLLKNRRRKSLRIC